MIIVYLDQLGCYAAVLAASCRAGIIAKRPTVREICRLPNFAANRNLRVGNFYYIGKDAYGSRVYTLGTGKAADLVTVSVGDLFKVQKVTEEVRLIDVSRYNDILVRLSWQAARFKFAQPTANYLAACRLKKNIGRLVAEQEQV